MRYEIDFIELIKYWFSKKKIIGLTLLVFTILSIILSLYVLPKQYASEMRIYVTPKMTKTYVEILEGEEILQNVKDDLNMSDIDKIKSSLSVEKEGNTEVISIKAVTEDPDLSNDIVQGVVDEFSFKKIHNKKINISVVSESEVNENPITPNKKKVFILCLGIPLFAVLSYYLVEFVFFKRLKNNQDVQRELNMRTVLDLNSDKDNTEEYKNILNYLQYYNADKMISLIGLISTKTENKIYKIAFNLAYEETKYNKKVLIVDCDYSKFFVNNKLNDGNTEGLNDGNTEGLIDLLFDNSIKIHNIIHKYKTNGKYLYYIPFGNRNNIHYSYLNSQRLKKIFNSLKEEFDLILCIYPPLCYVEKYNQTLNNMDTFIYVVSSELDNGDLVKSKLVELKDSDIDVCGIALINKNESKYGPLYHYLKSKIKSIHH